MTPLATHVGALRTKDNHVETNIKETPLKGSDYSQAMPKRQNPGQHYFLVNSDKTRAQETILWDSLPTNLIKPGKGMVRRRNIASIVASEAQKEASSAAALVKSLGLFADLCSSATTDNPQICLTKFFALDRLINNSTSLILKDGSTQISNSLPSERDKSSKKTSRTRNAQNFQKLSLETHMHEMLELARGDGTKEIQELKDNLLKESQLWFLKFLECALSTGFRPEAHLKKGKNGNGRRRVESDDEIAVTLTQLKHANDWLDQLRSNVEPENNRLRETIDQLKQKIYTCLLDNVDSVASALESRSDRS